MYPRFRLKKLFSFIIIYLIIPFITKSYFYNMFAIDHEFEENQVKAFLKILGVFSCRIYGEDMSVWYQNDQLFSQFNLPLDKLYASEQPTLEELKSVAAKIFYQQFELEYLLCSLKKQFIQTEVCDFFLQCLKPDSK